MADPDAFGGLSHALELDVVGDRAGYLVVGTRGTHVRLSASAYHLLRAVRTGLSFEVLAQEVARRGDAAVSAAEVEAAYRRIVERLAEIDGRSPGAALPPGFWFRQRLMSQTVVDRIAAVLSLLFNPWPAVAVLSAVGLALSQALSSGIVLNFEGGVFWPAYALFTLSLIVHELGHASACRRFGAQPDEIGFTIYWVFPAFYSDVTTAWRLRRWQRVIVDLGGAFFQLAVGAGYWLAFLLTGRQAFEMALFMILYSCLFSLNPIFKFDGYWVLADALGVTHLGAQPARLLRRLAARLRGRASEPLPWPRWVSAVLAVYTPLSLGVWVYFVARLAPRAWTQAQAYPELLRRVAGDLRLGTPDWTGIGSLAASTLLLLVCGLMIRHLARRLLAGFRSFRGISC